jgi:hypothetical protein
VASFSDGELLEPDALMLRLQRSGHRIEPPDFFTALAQLDERGAVASLGGQLRLIDGARG